MQFVSSLRGGRSRRAKSFYNVHWICMAAVVVLTLLVVHPLPVMGVEEGCVYLNQTTCNVCNSTAECNSNPKFVECSSRLKELNAELLQFCQFVGFDNAYAICQFKNNETVFNMTNTIPQYCVDCIGANLSQVPCLLKTAKIVLLK